ncbi:hypothetical protein E2I00_006960, partial [Balaenoptera physalus]
MSALTPPTDMPTPTTDKITQAAMETIYLCKFRVSMDGEWLCLRELDDISLTPDPEPTHEDSWEDLTDLVEQMRDDTEDPNYLMANERMNLMNMAKLSIKGLIESALNLGRTLDSDYAPLQQFFVSKMQNAIMNRTPVGRGRAWLRLALMQKKLSEYMKALINKKELLSEFYEPNALMMEEEGAIIAGLLVGLNVIDANFCMKGEDLDSQVGVIDFSMYLKDGNSSKGSEGDGQITAILDQKNYVEELNRHLNATVNNLQAKVDALEKSNTKLTEELAVANNRIITLQEDMERVKEESSYILESNRKGPKPDRTSEGQALSEARKHLKEETQLRLFIWLTSRLRQAERGRQSAELDNRLFKQDFGDKINSLQLEVEELTRQRNQLELELKQERERRLQNNKSIPGKGSQKPEPK